MWTKSKRGQGWCGATWHAMIVIAFLIMLDSAVSFSNLVPCFLLRPAAAGSPLFASDTTSPRRSSTVVLSSAPDDQMPVEKYKKTARAMLDLVRQAHQAMEEMNLLTTNLEMYKALDPDIAGDDAALDSIVPPLPSQSQRLHQAMQRALDVTAVHGRSSRQAEQAWIYVTRHVLERNHPALPYLSHPSYRDSYARSLLLRQRQQQQQPQVGGSMEQALVDQTTQATVALQEVELALRDKLTSLDDRKLAQAALLKSLMK